MSDEDERGHFTDEDLGRICAEFTRGNDDLFFGVPLGWSGDRMNGFCVWCKREVSPAGEHAPTCEGQARQRLAAKAKRLRQVRGKAAVLRARGREEGRAGKEE